MNASDPDGWVDLFISYAGPDRPWAEWIAWQVATAGFSVELDVWDWAVGDSAVLRMNDALARAERILALYSPAYFDRNRFTTDEWAAVMAERPDIEGQRRLIPVRVSEVDPPPILRPLVYRDLFGLAEARARQELLASVGRPARPTVAPAFPDRSGGVLETDTGPRAPGSLPVVWNVPPRNPCFTGREVELAALRSKLCGGERALVQALHGMGGVGKTQLAIEYSHLFAGDYQLVWWVEAERPELIGEQLVQLGAQTGWVEPTATTPAVVSTVLDRLHRTPRCLVVFDNAENGTQLRPWLPRNGHVIITSRSTSFVGIAARVEVDVFTRAESIALLNEQLPTLTADNADTVAETLGDLPLALAQAAGLMAHTGMTVAEYLTELNVNATELLDEAPPADYPASLAATIRTSLAHLTTVDPAGAQLLHLCAHLAPEPIPLAWITGAPIDLLPAPLAQTSTRPLALRRTLGRFADLGLARVTSASLQIHRLTQAVLRDRLTATDHMNYRRQAEGLVVAAEPDDDGTDPASWPAWVTLLPHLLALDPPSASPAVWRTAGNALYYLLSRGDYYALLPLASNWHERWLATLGPDHDRVLKAATHLSNAYRALGRQERAHALDEDVLARRRRVLGDDHPSTLISAHNFATGLSNLGEYEKARALNEDTLARRRRVLGEDHPYTLTSAHSLAVDLSDLGEHEKARALNEEVLARRRRVFGEDHPYTLTSAHNLAINLSDLGEHEKARALKEDTLARRRLILGDDHPHTLNSAHSLAASFSDLGQHEKARVLNEDTLVRRRLILGDDHPHTLNSAQSLAIDLSNLGEHEKALALLRDIPAS